MYQQNGVSSGAKWFFWLAVIVLALVFALGLNVKDATWISGDIASATANQMNIAADIEKQKAELELQVVRKQTELQIAQEIQETEVRKLEQQQALDAQARSYTLKADLQKNLYSTLNFGLKMLVVALALGLFVVFMNLGLGVYKIFGAKAKGFESKNSINVGAYQNNYRPSLGAQMARQREQQERRRMIKMRQTNQFFKESIPVWPDNNSEILGPENHYQID